jgi:hypothetical protein
MDNRNQKQKRIDDQILIHNLSSFLGPIGNVGAGVYTGITAKKGEGIKQGVESTIGSAIGSLGGGIAATGATYGGLSALEKILKKSAPSSLKSVSLLLAGLTGAGMGSSYAMKKLMGYDEK